MSSNKCWSSAKSTPQISAGEFAVLSSGDKNEPGSRPLPLLSSRPDSDHTMTQRQNLNHSTELGEYVC